MMLLIRMNNMEPKIIDRDAIILVGFSFFGDPFSESGGWTEENEIGRLWSRFMKYFMSNPNRVKHIKDAEVAYEVHIQHAETAQKGHYEVFVGVEVEKLGEIPVELLVKILPPAKYAVFTLEGEQIASDWSMMIYEWLEDSGYQAAGDYGFQRYDARFKGVDNLAESVLEAYVPVQSNA